MHIFKQKCKMCTAAEYEEPTFQLENIEIAIENLVNQIMQKFYNVPIEVVPRSCVSDGRQSGPHDSDNCEGCALGICKCYIDLYDKAAILPSVIRRQKDFLTLIRSYIIKVHHKLKHLPIGVERLIEWKGV